MEGIAVEPASESQRLISKESDLFETLEPVELAASVEHGFLAVPDAALGAAKMEAALGAARGPAVLVREKTRPSPDLGKLDLFARQVGDSRCGGRDGP
jgi:hypothetical protein